MLVIVEEYYIILEYYSNIKKVLIIKIEILKYFGDLGIF